MTARDQRPSYPFDLLLWALVGLLLIGALTASRARWPSFVGDESTYLMAADSLIRDFDLRYERDDYDRFVEHWSRPPEGLILQSGDHGKTLTFGKPFFYPAYAAPFVRVAPRRGALIANVLLLALAARVAVRALRPRVGPAAGTWVALFIFGSAAFAYVFWAHADLFLMALTAIGLGLLFSPEAANASDRGAARWATSGVLLAIVAFSRPIYLPLLAAAAFCVRPPRARRLTAFLTGAVLLLGASLATHKLLSGSWTSYDGERAGFYERTGFPDVDFPRSEWDAFVHRWGNFAWHPSDLRPAPATSLRLGLWNGVYFLLGRHVGVLPYFLPLLLGLTSGRKDGARLALLAGIAAVVIAILALRPFNFFGGGASIANRYFLPVYPAFWFLAAAGLKIRWLVAVAAASALFVWPLWTAPRAFLKRPDHTYRFVSPLAERALPYETTQSHLKPAGQEDLRLGGLWIKLLDAEIRSHDGSHLSLAPGARGRLLVGSERPLAAVELAVLTPATVDLEISGAEVDVDMPRGERRVFRLRLADTRARHPMWWSPEPVYLYQIAVRFQGESSSPIPFSLTAANGA